VLFAVHIGAEVGVLFEGVGADVGATVGGIVGGIVGATVGAMVVGAIVTLHPIKCLR